MSGHKKPDHDKINRTLNNEAELDELLDGHWDPNTSNGSIPMRGNSLVRRLTLSSSKVNSLLEVQDISAPFGRKSTRQSRMVSAKESFKKGIN